MELRATAPDEGRRTAGVGSPRRRAAAVNGDYFDMMRFTRSAPRAVRVAHGPRRVIEHRDAVFVAAPGGRADVLDDPAAAADVARIP